MDDNVTLSFVLLIYFIWICKDAMAPDPLKKAGSTACILTAMNYFF